MATVTTCVRSRGIFLAELLSAVFHSASLVARGRSQRPRPRGPHGYGPDRGSSPGARGPGGVRRRNRLTGWLNRNRRLTVALLLCIAAGITVQQLTPAPADTVGVLAAARDLPAGKTLDAADMVVLNIPTGLLPGGSFSEGASLRGTQLAVPLRQGQLISDSQLLGPGLLAGSPPGSAAVPLRMADPSSVRLVSPGQLINVVMSGENGFDQPGTTEVLATGVPVLWTATQGGKEVPWLGDSETDGLIVVAADAVQSRRLAGASTQGKLFFVLVAPAPG
jgi:pilus assembly protein CpaB